ncbi:MAG: ketoacyl-ACP synthase III [Proteobacteria bacterium]|nr:ketoacyl-ACP synthase III [Pseudomonadota bacterium]
MALLSYDGIAITGISACVPRKRIDNRSLSEPFSGPLLEKTIKTTGIVERRIADASTCASDLCCQAASRLMDSMGIDRDTIDVVIFVTQSPDFKVPATAPLIQHRLGLKKETAAFDVNLGCSGYVYGLSMAYAYATQAHICRVLLLVGDTPSKYVSSLDKTTGILFGDGGTATIVEKKKDAGKSFFSLNSDGSGANALQIKAGGFRHPSTPETLANVTHEDGSIRNEEHLTMDGGAIFNFTIKQVPADIKKLLEFSNTDISDIDYLVYHQANKFITDHLTKKLKFPLEKVPYSLGKFGNTTCLTIPVTLVSEIGTEIETGTKNLVLSGFGIGLSWATAILTIKNCHVLGMIEV